MGERRAEAAECGTRGKGQHAHAAAEGTAARAGGIIARRLCMLAILRSRGKKMCLLLAKFLPVNSFCTLWRRLLVTSCFLCCYRTCMTGLFCSSSHLPLLHVSRNGCE